MPTAICTACNFINHYSNSRGTRLVNLPCQQCAKYALKRAQWSNGAWILPTPKPKKTRGEAVECVLCKKTFYPGTDHPKISKLDRDRIVEIDICRQPIRRGYSHAMKVLLPAGSFICHMQQDTIDRGSVFCQHWVDECWHPEENI